MGNAPQIFVMGGQPRRGKHEGAEVSVTGLWGGAGRQAHCLHVIHWAEW